MSADDPRARGLGAEREAPDRAEAETAEPTGAAEASASGEHDADADDFLRRFHRPVRPPSPQPEQRAESAGGAFVAHYTVARPVAATRRHASVPGVQVLRDSNDTADASERHDTSRTASDTSDLAALIRVDSTPDPVSPRDLSTAVRTQVARRRMVRALAAVALGALALFVLAAAFFGRGRAAPVLPASAAVASPASLPASAAIEARTASALRVEMPLSASPPSTSPGAPRSSAARSLRPAPSIVPTSVAPRAPAPRRDPTTDMLPDEP